MTGIVQFFDHTQTGAPVVNGVAGALIGVLDACLVNGLNTNNVTSLVVAAEVATVDVPAGHGKRVGDVVEIAGASPAGLNGKKRILTATTTTYDFDAAGISDQTATGSIVEKLAPVGWVKAFVGTNLGVYQPASVQATGFYLRVDDTDPQSGRAVGYESMTDIDTGVDPFPTPAQFAGGVYWHRSDAADATPRDWFLVGDGERFILGLRYDNGATSGYSCLAFGDIASDKAGDAFQCVITGSEDANAASTFIAGSHAGLFYNKESANGCYMARDVAQLSKSVPWYPSAMAPHASLSVPVSSGSDDWELKYPSQVDQGLVFLPIMILETGATDPIFRGLWPGAYWSIQQQPGGHGDRMDGAPGLPGRELLIITTGRANSGVIEGRLIVDLTGPWT